MKKLLGIVFGLVLVGVLSSVAYASTPFTPPTATLVNTPTLSLGFDSKRNEASLTGYATVSINAGSEDVRVYTVFPKITDANGINQYTNDTKISFEAISGATKEVLNFTIGGSVDVYRIKAGETAVFKATATDNPKLMFAGAYKLSLREISFATSLTDTTANFEQYASVPTTTSNVVAIVGEKSPYISSTNSPLNGKNAVISGARFSTNKPENKIYISNVYKGNIAATRGGATLTIPNSWFGGANKKPDGSTSDTIQIENPKYGKSNIVSIQVNDAPTACYNFTKNLTLGSTGSDVTALQNFLKSKGFLSGNATGYFGSSTRTALKAYQVQKGIRPADGYFGVITRASVNADCQLQTNLSFTVLSPNGGEVWSSGSLQTIKWSSNNISSSISSVLLQISKGTNTVYSEYVPNTGVAQITLPNIGTGNDFKVTIGYKTNEGIFYSDSSDNYFTINSASTIDITSTCPKIFFDRSLTVGSSGNDVAALQNFLKAKGYLFTDTTGYFSSLTKSGLAAYQVAKSITPADGDFGPITRASVNADCASIVVSTVTLQSVPNNPNDHNSFDYVINSSTAFDKVVLRAICNDNEVSISAKGGMLCNEDLVLTYGLSKQYSYPIAWSSKDGKEHTVGMSATAYLNGTSIGTDKDAITVTVPIQSPSITVVTPNGGEVLRDAETYRIKWNQNGGGGTVIIWLKTCDNCTNKIAIDVPNIGYYDWVVQKPNYSDDHQYKIKIMTDGGLVDESDNYFTISAASTQPSITVLSPNGGETYKVGDTVDIKWKTDLSTSTQLYLQLEDGRFASTGDTAQHFSPIPDYQKPVPNTGVYSWTIPATLGNGYMKLDGGTLYKLSVGDYYGKTYDWSDNYFTINSATTYTKPDITVTGVTCNPSSPKINEKIICSVTVYNNSSVDITKSFDVNIQGIATTVSAPLNAWQSKTVTASTGFSFSRVGTYTLNFPVDIWSSVDESDENNNTFTMPITISNIQTSYPGFFISLDKNSYNKGDTATLKLSRADGSSTPYPIDLYIVNGGLSEHSNYLLKSNLSVSQNTGATINIDQIAQMFPNSNSLIVMTCAYNSTDCLNESSTIRNSTTLTINPTISAPVISSISPASGVVGVRILIEGTGFTPDSTVYFGGQLITTANSRLNIYSSGNQISFTVPMVNLGDYDIYVKNSNGTSNYKKFTVTNNSGASAGSAFSRFLKVLGW